MSQVYYKSTHLKRVSGNLLQKNSIIQSTPSCLYTHMQQKKNGYCPCYKRIKLYWPSFRYNEVKRW